MSITAIILAAGYSSRMNGELKALLPFAGKSMLALVVQSLQSIAKENIWVVSGYENQKVEDEAKKLGVKTIHNPDFAQGMFSSVRVAIQQTIENKSQAVLILPVDAPLIRSQTINNLLQAWHKSKVDIVIPSFNGQKAHPPIIASSYFQDILAWNSTGGLQAYFDSLPVKRIEIIELADQGLVMDLDTWDLYQEALTLWQSNNHGQDPSFAEACSLLWHVNLPITVITHSYCVAFGSLRLALALQAKGKVLNLNWHLCGAILHDIARLEKKHAQRGQELLDNLGWPNMAQIVLTHTHIPKDMLEAMIQADYTKYSEALILACATVYMADKLHYMQDQVSIFERFARTKADYKDNGEALEIIDEREKVALIVEEYLTNLLGELPENIINIPSDNPLEHELLASKLAKF